MVYIAKDGTVYDQEPWGINRVLKIFYGTIEFFIFFFKSLVGMDVKPIASSGSSGGRSSGRGGNDGGGGGGGPFRPGGGGGGPSKRIFTMRDINPPSVGGCPGGACGR